MPGSPRVTFLTGNDEFAIARRVTELSAPPDAASAAGWSISRLDARLVTDEDLNTALNAVPFLAPYRVTVLEGPSARWRDAKARAAFAERLKALPATTRLIITEVVEPGRGPKEIPGSSHWLGKALAKLGEGFATELHNSPLPVNMPQWIQEQAKAHGGQFDKDAAVRLAERSSADTRQAMNEIDKLLAYVDWSRPVTAADVELLSPFTADTNVFKMVDAIANGDGKTAQQLLQRYVAQYSEFEAWAMIIRQFRFLLLARAVLDRRCAKADMERALHAAGYPVDHALEQARRFSAGRLDAIYHQLLEIDEQAKNGRMPLDVSMELLIAGVAVR